MTATVGDGGATKSELRRGLLLAVLLAALAGIVDAIGFIRLGHLFVSFMSGNSTQFAVTSWPRPFCGSGSDPGSDSLVCCRSGLRSTAGPPHRTLASDRGPRRGNGAA